MSNTRLQKLELLEWIANLKDKALINELIQWKKSHQHISIEQYNKELDEANARIDAGEYITHDEVEKESRSWVK